jgi:hypothetical protein
MVFLSTGIAFADNSEKIAALTDEYSQARADYDEALGQYNSVIGQYWWASGSITEDYGDVIYIYGTMAKITDLFTAKQDVNIKIISPNRNLFIMGAYNYSSDMTSLAHYFVGVEEGRNAFNAPIPIYILQYEDNPNAIIYTSQATMKQAKNRM